MTEIMGFNGFPKECVQFLVELRENNNREWFTEHKPDFKTYVQEPTNGFANEMAKLVESISPSGLNHPEIQFSVYRIYRDIRFSKDKTPYKTHIGLLIWEGERAKMENSSYYFHLEPPNLMLGTGIYGFSKPLLTAYRDSVVDPEFGPQLVDVLQTISGKGYTVGGEQYKRVPRGYDPEHELADLLLYKGLYAGYEKEIPEEFYSSEILDYCLQVYRDLSPLHAWLYQMTGRVSTA
jgi:uncharacterized protein (TIGR02453 family)